MNLRTCAMFLTLYNHVLLIFSADDDVEQDGAVNDFLKCWVGIDWSKHVWCNGDDNEVWRTTLEEPCWEVPFIWIRIFPMPSKTKREQVGGNLFRQLVFERKNLNFLVSFDNFFYHCFFFFKKKIWNSLWKMKPFILEHSWIFFFLPSKFEIFLKLISSIAMFTYLVGFFFSWLTCLWFSSSLNFKIYS